MGNWNLREELEEMEEDDFEEGETDEENEQRFWQYKQYIKAGFVGCIVIPAAILLVGGLHVVYAIFWEVRANEVVLENPTAQQIQMVEEDCNIAVPNEAVDICLFWSKGFMGGRVLGADYKVPVGEGAYEEESQSIGIIRWRATHPSETMIQEQGINGTLPLMVEIFFIDGAIGVVLFIILWKKRISNLDKAG